MNFDGLRGGGVELVFKKLPISRIWGYPGPKSRAKGHAAAEGVPAALSRQRLRTGREARPQQVLLATKMSHKQLDRK